MNKLKTALLAFFIISTATAGIIFFLLLYVGHNIKKASDPKFDENSYALFNQSVKIPNGAKSIAMIAQFTGGTFQYGPPEQTAEAMAASIGISMEPNYTLINLMKTGETSKNYDKTFTFEIVQSTETIEVDAPSELYLYLNTLDGNIRVYVVDPDREYVQSGYKDLDLAGTDMSELAKIYNPKPGIWTVNIVGDGIFSFKAATN
jgi:hypothetical protein